MASRRHLPSDPEFLLEYMENIESDISDDEFDGYIDEEEGVCSGGIGNNDTEGVCSDVFEEELGVDDTEGVRSDIFEEELGCGNDTEGVCSDVFGEELGCGNDTEGVCSDVFGEELGCDVTLVNAYVLYYKTCEGKVLSHMDFRIEVAKALIGAECYTSLQLAPVVDSPARLIGHNHFLEPSGQQDFSSTPMKVHLQNAESLYGSAGRRSSSRICHIKTSEVTPPARIPSADSARTPAPVDHDVKSLVANEMAKVNEKWSTLEIKVQALEADKGTCTSEAPAEPAKRKRRYSVVSSGLPS
ncbi:hypothetical protein EMCRGX_G005605 [Ephydatia muelleri]